MKVGKNKWEAGRLHKGYSPIDSNLLLYTFFSSSHEVKLDRRSVSSLKRSEHSDEDVFFCISVRLLCNARDIIFSNDWPYRLFSFATSILIGKGTGLFASIHRELQHEEHLQMMSGERSAGGHHEVGGNNGWTSARWQSRPSGVLYCNGEGVRDSIKASHAFVVFENENLIEKTTFLSAVPVTSFKILFMILIVTMPCANPWFPLHTCYIHKKQTKFQS